MLTGELLHFSSVASLLFLSSQLIQLTYLDMLIGLDKLLSSLLKRAPTVTSLPVYSTANQRTKLIVTKFQYPYIF